MTYYYRLHDTDACPVESLLSEAHQISRVWVGSITVRCQAPGCYEGRVPGRDYESPDESCPVCRGSGDRVIDTQRGVSCCRSIRDLEKYMEGRSAYRSPGVVLVELRGDESSEADVDAAHGAVLVTPSEIVSVRSVDDLRIAWGE